MTTAAEDFQAAAERGEVARVVELAARVSDYARRDALRTAAERDRLDVVRSLAGLGVPLEYVLANAVAENAVGVARWLIAERPTDVTEEGFFASACEKASPALLVELLERGASIDDRSGGWSGVMHAAREKRADVVELLLARGASPRGLVLAAAAANDLALAKRALELGDDLDFVDESGTSGLMMASSGHVQLVRWLLDEMGVTDKPAKASTSKTKPTTKTKAKPKTKRAKAPKGRLDVADSEGRTAIAYAAREGRLEVVEILAKHGASLDPALAYATFYNKEPATLAVVRWLLDHGVDVDARQSSSSDTALINAAEAGWDEMCELLLSHGAKVDAENIIDTTPLSGAGRNGHADVVRRLLDAGAKVGKSSRSYSASPLEKAIEGGNEDVIRLLIDRGALGTEMRTPPLFEAARHGRVNIVELLLEHGVDIDEAEDSYDRNTALRLAAGRGHIDVVRLLLDRGAVEPPPPREADADPEPGTIDKYSAIRRAAENAHLDLVMLLADRGLGSPRGIGLVAGAAAREDLAILTRAIELDPDVDAPGEYERRPVHQAAERGHLENVRLLLDRGADPNIRDEDGKTAHRRALDADHYEIAQLLEQRGAKLDVIELLALAKRGDETAVRELFARPINVDVKGELGRTALHEAAEHGHTEIAGLLLERGAAADVADEDGWTAFMEAAEMGHLEIVRLLLERGALPFTKERSGFTAYELARDAGHADVVAYLESKSADEDPLVSLEKAIEADDADRVAMVAARIPINDWITNAARHGKRAVVEKMLALGCPVDYRDSGDRTPLSEACEGEHLAIVKQLLAAGASPSREPEGGAPALGRAIWGGATEIVTALLDAGFSPTTPYGDEPPVVRALSSGHPEIARMLLERGAEVTGKAGAAILAKALSREDHELVELLLAKDAPVDTENYYVREALIGWLKKGRKVTLLDANHALRHASYEGDAKLFDAALAAGADPNAETTDDPPLLHAIKNDHWNLAERLLAAGADPNLGEYYGRTIAAQLAADGKFDRLEQLATAGARLTGCLVAITGGEHCPTEPKQLAKLLKLCLAHGEQLDAVDEDGKTALFHAAAKARVELALALVEAGARAGVVVAEDGTTVVMEAAGAGSLALVRALVERGGDLNAKNNDGTTAVMRAARAGAEDVVEWCLERGASPAGCLAESGGSGKLALVKRFLAVCELEETDGAKWTAAMNAAAGTSKKVFELLLERGAKVEQCATAAAWSSTKDNLELALARGAAVDSRDFAGRTPLIIAASQDNTATIQLLLSKRASLDLQDEDGETALIVAARSNDAKTCKLLVKAGAKRGLRSKDGKAAVDHAWDYDLKRILEV